MSKDVQLVWLNPVIEKIVCDDYNMLVEFIEERGYRVITSSNQAHIIQNMYGEYIKNVKSKPVIDSRCPAIIELIENKNPELIDNIAPIYPILIACAMELYEKHIKENPKVKITIVTPCTQLVDFGNRIMDDKVEFITWNLFKKNINYNKQYKKSLVSPIPLGFFDSLNIKVQKASGEKEIEDVMDRIVSGSISKEIDLCEFLFCKDGCHNGDGV